MIRSINHLPNSLLLLLFILSASTLPAQGVSINGDGSLPHESAMLDIQSTSKGILIPRMTMEERDLIVTPATGLLIFQTDNTMGLYMYNGTGWNILTSGSDVWSTAGNGGMDPSTQFIGTTDASPFRIRLNNNWAGELNGGSGNLAIGDSSGISNTTGLRNISYGNKSLSLNTIGSDNVAIGYRSLAKSTVNQLVAIGVNALSQNTTGDYNTGIGTNALSTNTTGYKNTSVGYGSLRFNTTGVGNTSMGYDALLFNTTGSYNTAFGNAALSYNSEGTYNIGIGHGALVGNVSGSRNTAVGGATLNYLNTSDNTAIGYKAIFYATSGSQNTAVGSMALETGTTGTSNVAIGAYALNKNNGSSNTAVGVASLLLNTTGSANCALGRDALYDNTSGSYNTAIGYNSLTFNTYGTHNVAVGYNSLRNCITGTYNVAVGYNSGSFESLYNTVSIGNSGYLNADHNQAFFGNLSHDWNGGNVTWSTYSDARIKTDITEEVKGLDFIKRLRPVTYHRDIDVQTQLTGNQPTEDFPHKYDIEQIKFSGFLAQEVEQAAIECGYEFSGITIPKNEHSVYTLSYESFVVPLVKAMQEQQVIIETQNQKIEALEERMAAMEIKLKEK